MSAATPTAAPAALTVGLRERWPWIAYALLLALAAALRFGALTRVPHTLWVDEAWFGLQGRVVLSGQDWLPLRPPGLGIGDSAFQIYAAALVQALGFPAAYSSRLASAVTGTLLVALAYPVLLGLFRPLRPGAAAPAAALLGVGVLATHPTALLFSRGGGQMAGAALATLLAAGGLYQAFRRLSWRWAALTGLVVGLGQTTYEAALGLPLLVAAYTAVRWAWPGPAPRRRVLLLGGLVLAVALAAFAPMLLFYWTHPGIYLAHAGQTQAVARAGGVVGGLAQALSGLWRVWAGLSFAGDVQPGRNVAGRPLFDALASLLVWLGLGWTVWHARRHAPAQLLLVWLGVMSLPSALSDEAPAFSRMLPMLPALAGLAGLGAVALVGWARRRGAAAGWGAAGLVGLALVVSGALSVRAYFVQWAGQPRLFDALHMGARQTADLALAYSRLGGVFVTPASNEFIAFPLALLLDETPVQRFDPAGCLPYPDRQPRDTFFGVIQVMDPATLPALAAAYPSGQLIASVPHPDGYAYSLFFQVPARAPAPVPEHPLDVTFANGVRLLGYSAPAAAAPGETITLRLFWAASPPVTGSPNAFVHIGQGRFSQPLIAQHDGPLCPGFSVSRWQLGYVHIESRSVTVAADAAPGAYDLRVGLYEPAAQVRLAITAATVPIEDDRAVLGPFDVR